MLIGVAFIHSDQEEAELLVVLVCENVENAILLIVDDLLDAADVEFIVQVNFLLSLHVDVNAVFGRGDDHQVLVLVHLEELRLPIERHLEVVDRFDALGLRLCEVKLQDPVLLHEDECCVLGLPRWQSFEVELHTDLVEDRDVFHSETVHLLKLVLGLTSLGRPPLENEKLVRLLLFHDEVFATDAGDVPIVTRLSESNDLIWLPRFRLQESDGHLTDSLVSLRVMNIDLVNVRHEECLHRWQVEAH